jgi:hypothetical protein
LSSPIGKNILIFRIVSRCYEYAIPFLLRGALRESSRTLGWDAVDAGSVGATASQGGLRRERVSRARKTNGAEADGKSVWSWHPLLVSSRRRRVGPTGCGHVVNSPATEARRIRLRGEYAIRRNTIAWGMPDVSGASAVNTRAHTQTTLARTRLRVHWAPGIPRALVCRRRKRQA